MPPQTPILKQNGIRFFSNENLQASVDRALASATSNSAVLSLEKNETGWNAAVATKIGEHWSIVAGYTHDQWGHGVATKVKWNF